MRRLTAGRRPRVAVPASPVGNDTESLPLRAHLRATRHRAGALRAAVAVLLLGGACGEGGVDNERESAGATTTTTEAAAPPSSAAGMPVPAQAASSTTAPRGGATVTTAPAPSATGSAAVPKPTFATPGTYRYVATGQFTSALTGPQPRNGETALIVEAPSGDDQRSVRRGFGRTTEQVLRLDRSGAHLVSMRLTDQGLDKEIRPSPPVLALPADATVGRTWAWRAMSTDGATTVDASFRAVRTEEVTVAGRRVRALVVEAILTLAGDVVSTSRQTLWISVSDRLVVRQDEVTEGRLGFITFSSTSSETLTALTPG